MPTTPTTDQAARIQALANEYADAALDADDPTVAARWQALAIRNYRAVDAKRGAR